MMEELGSGFYLAMHDLEIRGAGEFLGESQSGEMQEVGFALYAEMLNAAVKSLRAGKEPELAGGLNLGTEINLHAPALLPEDYCADIHEAWLLYKRLSTAIRRRTGSHARGTVGPLRPCCPILQILLETHRLRIAAKPLGILLSKWSGERSAAVHSQSPP